MVFSSAVFIFAFLPLVYLGFLVSQRVRSGAPAIYWLIGCSLFFYGWWNPRYVPLIVLLLGANFGASRAIAAAQGALSRRFWLTAGLTVNIGALLYYKYTHFFVAIGNSVTGAHLVVGTIVLPLGISFFTFQKIAFLIDTYYGRVQRLKLADYCLFVLFFPQLIAGPIVHHAEVVPQFAGLRDSRRNWDHAALGLSIFFIGLFKKVVFADTLAAADVTPVFAAAAGGVPPQFLEAWLGVLGYTLQLYFDFSGYSDMAIGAALLFGIRLPQNFNSPFKAANIIDFWRRWHITLTRFLTAYIYNPLTLMLTRRRLGRGLKGIGGKNTTPGSFLTLLAWPTLLTMFVSGFWHGAGFTFILWGLLHGVYLTINHAWRWLVPYRWPKALGVALTFLCVVASMAFFRADSVSEALMFLRAMAGANGVQWQMHGGWHLAGLAALVAWVLMLPNAQQIFARFETALGTEGNAAPPARLLFAYNWKWSAFVGVSVLVSLLYVQSNIAQEFLYFDF